MRNVLKFSAAIAAAAMLTFSPNNAEAAGCQVMVVCAEDACANAINYCWSQGCAYEPYSCHSPGMGYCEGWSWQYHCMNIN